MVWQATTLIVLNLDAQRVHQQSQVISGSFQNTGNTYPLPTTDTARKIDMKHYVYRYGIGAKSWGSPPTACSPSGIAEVLGNDFIVSLGCGFGSFGGSAGTREEQAGTLMHELGHTLGLGHGGPAYDTPSPPFGGTNYNMNCKPNYFSVMSYSRQIPTASLPAGNTINDWDYVRSNGAPSGGTSPNLGTSTWPGTALDFERAAHADLNEA